MLAAEVLLVQAQPAGVGQCAAIPHGRGAPVEGHSGDPEAKDETLCVLPGSLCCRRRTGHGVQS